MKKTVTPAKKERSSKKIIQKNNHIPIKNNLVTEAMRKLVLQWLIELSHTFTPLLSKQTLFLTIWIFDQVLSKYGDINPKNLQLLAVTCLQLSAKYEEVYPPRMIQLIQYTSNAYSKKEMVDLQQKILIALEFQITKPTRYTFFTLKTHNNSHLSDHYIKIYQHSRHHNQKRYFDFVTFLLELSLLKHWKGYSEQQISDGVILLANKVMRVKNVEQIQDQEQIWSYQERINEIAFEMVKIWKQNQNSFISQHYDCDRLSFAGGLKIIF